MSTLPSEYFEFKSVWESVPIEERSVNKLTERLRLIEMRLPSKSTDSTALVATRKKVFKKPERNVTSVASKDECSLLRDGRVRLKGVRTVHGLYALEIRVLCPKVCVAAEVCVASADQSLQLWHERLRHQNKAHVKDILRKYQIKGDAKDSQICDGCCYGKQSRRPFGTRKQRATTPGELINIGVCGPMQQQSLGGAKYYVCFKDDFTKYRRVFFMQSKNEVSKCLETFLNEAKNTGHMIKEVLSDGGGEVINSTVKSLLEKSGISSHMEIVKKPLKTPEADVEKEMEEISCNGGAIAWRSQRQNCIALSTTEAEFIAASQAAKEAIWLNNLLKELCCVTSVPSLQIDNQSAIRLVKNPEFHNRTKHIDIRYKFIREQYENKQLNVINCSSEVQAADILTKPLAKDRFLKLKLMLGMYNFGN
ncbi:retrovirus-related Pol polyprotein from transposon TNT 1-94 [Trichonephila clavata]|uniref:Retrovirus-related Pol polyprotein from transposon TNT 1-94 n=1 Tax=Trichonephila clavata TaxID=2740835 RepID=A0A8X6LR37_TRICU|nr:retrovirus-related Pol polyprotein from transposon TNT 1-94 [Trichonephila clavata]